VNVSEPFIARPIATSLLMAAIALFGVVSYHGLAVSDLPTVDYPTVNVNASLPGGDPTTMASALASPLERQFTTIAGIDEMTSSSSTGSSSVVMQFDLNRNIDSAAVDVQTAIAAAMPLLPSGLPAPPSFRKVNPADQPILQINLTSDTLQMSKVDEYAEDIMAPRISMVSGVSQVNVQGAQKFAVRVQVDPNKLQAQGIGLNDIDAALQNWNVNQPTGQLFGPDSTYNIVAHGQLDNADAFRPVIISYKNGAPIRLEQVANVLDSVEVTTQIAWAYSKRGRQRSITLQVMRQPGTNVLEVTDAVRALLPELQSQLPPSVHISIRQDRSKNIREAFSDIQITMLVTLLLVVGVIFLFLHNGSATLIPALALPFSILGTFSIMKMLNYSLDNLSMMALILSIGFVVDDAIVMLENVVRHVEEGLTPLEAARKGSGEIGFTILTMTTSLAAVFIPILFMGGILGRLFREFAVTITSAILISGVVSVSLTPMLCSRFLKISHKQGRFASLLDRAFDRLMGGYRVSLQFVLRHRAAVLVVFVLVLVATVNMFNVVPKGFIPDTDNDQLNVNLVAAQGTSYYQMVQYTQQVAGIINGNPYVDALNANTGGGGPGGGGAPMNTGRLFVQLTPRRSRPMTAAQIAQQLRPQVTGLPGVRAFVTTPPAIQIGGQMNNSAYALIVQSLDDQELYTWAPRLEAAMAQLPELQDVNDNMQLKSPRVDLAIDRDKAAAFGLDATQIENLLTDAFGQKWSSTIYGARSQHKVILELDPKYQEQADSLQRISFRTPANTIVPLESVVNFREDVGPQTVTHYGQLPAVTLSFGLRPGVSLGAAVDHINQIAGRLLPATVTTNFQGSAKVFQASLTNLGLLLFIAIGVVYIVLGMLYESYIHPLTILSGLPSAGLGALLTVWAFGNELNIYSFVGLIMLIGIVKKNAIMQIDFALEQERRHGKSPDEAIYEGCIIRFRPIMMTTMAALLGSLPIALGYGAGGEARRPLGLAVVGGLVVSQMITLYLTPVVYTYAARLMPARKIAA
jgi:HAE1 family hydrophobic/amphiphilic exporter-1